MWSTLNDANEFFKVVFTGGECFVIAKDFKSSAMFWF